MVRQDDLGFRASAARHLGARAGDGEVILFLDGDTVPAPDYVAATQGLAGLNPWEEPSPTLRAALADHLRAARGPRYCY